MPARGQRKPKLPISNPADARGMAALIAAFVEHLRVRNYSERTVSQRQMCLGWFTLWCEERAITRPAEVTKPIIERYARFLYHYRKDDGAPLSFSSQFTRLVSVRMFFRWLTRHNYLLSNPASELELPRLEQRLPKAVLTISETEAVLRQPDVRDALGLRDRAILETFYSTGMRRFELAALHLTDIDSERGTVLIRQGKGRRDRMIPIGDRALVWITKYLGESRPSLVIPPDEGTLFLTKDGTPFVLAGLTAVVKRHLQRAEVNKGGGCHLFRHTCATLMLEGGADIRYIQQMLGHVSLETTQIYTQVSIRQLKAIHAATHPARLHRSPAVANNQPAGAPINTSAPATRAELLTMLDIEAEEEEAISHSPP